MPMTNKKDKGNGGMTLLKGGAGDRETRHTGSGFLSAEATNTRLMGTFGVHVRRRIGDTTLEQLYYIEAEEYGLEDYYESADGGDPAFEARKQAMFGALGGEWVRISEKQADYIISYYVNFNYRHGLDQPEGLATTAEMPGSIPEITEEEQKALMDKICIRPASDIELINYFLMRVAGCDGRGVSYLSSGPDPVGPIRPAVPATLLRNKVEKTGLNEYRCESLIEEDDVYTAYVTLIHTTSGRIEGSELISRQDISSWEASMILRRDEYVIYSSYKGGRPLLDAIMHATFPAATSTEYRGGILYIIYNRNNEHVAREIYRLDDDTRAMIYMLDSGDLIVSGSDPAVIDHIYRIILAGIASQNLSSTIDAIGRYRFPDPLLGKLIESGADDFKAFLNELKNNSDK